MELVGQSGAKHLSFQAINVLYMALQEKKNEINIYIGAYCMLAVFEMPHVLYGNWPQMSPTANSTQQWIRK